MRNYLVPKIVGPQHRDRSPPGSESRAVDLEKTGRLCEVHGGYVSTTEHRIHSHHHAGIPLVREGAALIPTLDAHSQQPGVFTAIARRYRSQNF